MRLSKLHETTGSRSCPGAVLLRVVWPSPSPPCWPCALFLRLASFLHFRAAFGKESEVLIGNLGDKLIPQQEILRDVSDLKALANMHESLEWLAGRTKAAFSSLSATQSKMETNIIMHLAQAWAFLLGFKGFVLEESRKQSSSISFFLVNTVVWHLLGLWWGARCDGAKGITPSRSSAGSFKARAFQQSLLMTLHRSR